MLVREGHKAERKAAKVSTHMPDPSTGPTTHLQPDAGLSRLPGPRGERFVELFKHGTLVVELYAPRGHDPQKPHTRDEIYVVASG